MTWGWGGKKVTSLPLTGPQSSQLHMGQSLRAHTLSALEGFYLSNENVPL